MRASVLVDEAVAELEPDAARKMELRVVNPFIGAQFYRLLPLCARIYSNDSTGWYAACVLFLSCHSAYL